MGVRVDKAGCDDLIGGVDFLRAIRQLPTNRGDPTVLYRDIRFNGVASASVVDRATAYYQVRHCPVSPHHSRYKDSRTVRTVR